MTPVPLDLPLRPPEAAELANLIFELAEGKALTDEIRNRVAARVVPLKLQSLTPWFGSLERDPVHRSTYYLAVDVVQGPPQLLHMAPAGAPTSSLFHGALLIGRMRRERGSEIVINAVPFGPEDTGNIDKLAGLDPVFLPRAHGPRPALVIEASAAAFEAFASIRKRTRKNVASVTGPYHMAVWCAIRSGWRQGYSAAIQLRISDEASLTAAREAIARWPRYSRFLVAGSPADVERMSVAIRQARSAAKVSGAFELGIEATNADLADRLGALKEAGHAAQIAAVSLEGGRIAEMAAAARSFHCALSVGAESESEDRLCELARETAGRFCCEVGADRAVDLADRLLG
jgi:hypothetical protein